MKSFLLLMLILQACANEEYVELYQYDIDINLPLSNPPPCDYIPAEVYASVTNCDSFNPIYADEDIDEDVDSMNNHYYISCSDILES